MLELQGQSPIYERAVDAPEIFIQANINQILSQQYSEFISELSTELKFLTLKFNSAAASLGSSYSTAAAANSYLADYLQKEALSEQ